MPAATPLEILERTRQMLSNVELGIELLDGDDPRRRTAGLHNVTTFGRAVTNVLENLRSIVPGAAFDAWYKPRSAAMNADPLLRWFYLLRSEILKEGGPALRSSTYISHMTGAELRGWMGPAPAGATSQFVGDNLGGSGWVVETSPGQEERIYVTLPAEAGITTTVHLPDAPHEHLGRVLDATDLVTLSRLYLAYLSELVDEASATFGR